MKDGIGHIFLAWRKGPGCSRVIIGVIKRNETDGVTFRYIKEGLEVARKDGFVIYPDFPDESKVYSDHVLDIFGQRLNKSEREDIHKYYAYWEIDPSRTDDKYYLLAHTQGLLPTDNFELLADYNPVRGLSFTSELCSLTHLQLPADILEEGDALRWERDTTNEFDKFAIKVFKGDVYVGRVKRIHSRVFYKKKGDRLKITVKTVNKNGHLNKAFIKVSF